MTYLRRNRNTASFGPFNLRWAVITVIMILAAQLAITCPGKANAQENPVDLDFDKALKTVFENSDVLRAKDDEVKTGEFKVNQARADYYPKLDAYSSYARTSLSSDIEISNPLTGSIFKVSMFPENRYNMGFTASQEVYSFGRRPAGVSSARLSLERTRLEKKELGNSLYDNVARVFGAALFARDNLSLQKENIQRARQKLKIVESRIDQGKASEYERIRAEILISKYVDRLSDAKDGYEKARIQLKNLMRWDNSYEFFIVGSLDDFKAAIPGSPTFKTEDTLPVKKMQLGYGILEQGRKISKSTYFPSLGVFAKYDWQNGYQPDINKIRGDWSVGVTANWRLFDGGLRKNRLRQASAEIERIAKLINDLESNLDSRMNLALSSIEYSSEKTASARDRLRLADEGIKIAEARYEQGLLGLSDLLDLELDRSDAQLSLLKAGYDLLIAKLDLKAALDYYPELESM